MFDSAKEARRYQQLRLEERAGHVRDLKMQVTFQINSHTASGGVVTIAKYVADFTYDRLINGQWTAIVEDVKGVQTDVFRLKRKLVEAQHGITIQLT
jgi:hypothetical protein